MYNEDEWFLEVEETEEYVYKAVLKNNEGDIYEEAEYVIDLSGDTIKAQAFGYFQQDCDLKMEAIELIKLYMSEM